MMDLMSEKEVGSPVDGAALLRETIADLLYQFAYDTTYRNGPALTTGGLSALEDAFAVLGWSDPHRIPEEKCQTARCPKRATCGTPTPDGYKRLCGDHYRAAILRAKEADRG